METELQNRKRKADDIIVDEDELQKRETNTSNDKDTEHKKYCPSRQILVKLSSHENLITLEMKLTAPQSQPHRPLYPQCKRRVIWI